MRYLLIVLWMLFGSMAPAIAHVSIGVNLSLYPELVRVPGYPVYYAPRLASNFFFYDGFYWVYEGDHWYVSTWYNGPWDLVAPTAVPLFVLRIPVRYYRNPPVYFRHWRADAPPRWGDHWGRDWQQRRSGWDRWNRRAAPKPAPLPNYQRQYSGERYPPVEQQQELSSRNYRHQPRAATRRQPAPERAVQAPPATAPQERHVAPRVQSPQSSGGSDVQRAAPKQAMPRPHGPAIQEQRPPQPSGAALPDRQPPRAAPPERQAPAAGKESPGHGKGAPPERGHGQGQEKEHDQGDGRGREHNR